MKKMRKNAIVKYCGDNEGIKAWGEYFEVFHKEGNVLKCSSLKIPEFGIVAVIPCSECKMVNQ